MTISQTAEYALRAIVWLARDPQTPLGTRRIARAPHVPAGYLARVLQAPALAGGITFCESLVEHWISRRCAGARIQRLQLIDGAKRKPGHAVGVAHPSALAVPAFKRAPGTEFAAVSGEIFRSLDFADLARFAAHLDIYVG